MERVKGFLVVKGDVFAVFGPECVVLGSGEYPGGLVPVLMRLWRAKIEVEGQSRLPIGISAPDVAGEELFFC